ncbi:flagellar basal body-associated FliL family protein [Maritalea mobilis]|uniref:flagellar basal body-associated FliL family protein n=1 Tax=Maritalea mobilis TaxID=483324 RepID=UPI001C94B85B|nr:flagellar basal body-associated FliL family protein [Maritalea mobilis]MBY6201809.1 flagellar basal body-associated FliL family protein [Maritalea mobilis]
MMRLVLPLLLVLLGLAGGVGAGLTLGASSSPDPAAEHHGSAETEGSGDGDDHAEGEDDGHGAAGHGTSIIRVTPAGADTEYVRLNNQFIVPIIRHGMVRSLVVMALTLEVPTGDNDLVFQHEPRLRDSFLQVMFAHANAGGFDGSFTEAAAMAPLRIGLREAAAQVLGNSVYDVLIVDITRQDA